MRALKENTQYKNGVTITSSPDVPTHDAVQGSMHLRSGQAINATIYINTSSGHGTTWTLANAIQA